jgi:Ni/Co efflux regulator RcnB
MVHSEFVSRKLVALAVAAALGVALAVPAAAGKPSWAGNGGGNGHGKSESSYADNKHGGGKNARDDDRGEHRKWDGKNGTYFGSRDRDVVRNYYREEYHKGKGCPPGLAKKHNGCMPPGQAKKWRYGHPLPRDVVWYPVPHELVIQLPAPPSGYKYVRVASDILMIAVGSSMVVDAVQDLGAI